MFGQLLRNLEQLNRTMSGILAVATRVSLGWTFQVTYGPSPYPEFHSWKEKEKLAAAMKFTGIVELQEFIIGDGFSPFFEVLKENVIDPGQAQAKAARR
ncbi:MAG: hypothetical protein Q9201_001471 [Fulgogasparrea decipioides]